MDYKIVQIIPAPNNMSVVYDDGAVEIKNKVVCLALIQHEDGETEIVPMDITEGDGLIGRIGSDFLGIEFS